MLVAFAPSNEFQSTLPRGERLLHKLCIGLLSYISIHAPARGATPLLLCITLGYRISIHAPARGATGHPQQSCLAGWIFQSTLPRGERRRTGILPASREYFNPRSREGSDCTDGSYRCCKCCISIHAPARGATAFIDIFSFTVRLYFISSH